MYCKECGKEIANDSKFCNHCGKSLDYSNSYNSLIFYLKKYFSAICLLIIWVLFALFHAKYNAKTFTKSDSIDFLRSYYVCEIFSYVYLITLVFVVLIYRLYSNYCKYHIILFDKSDTFKIKIIKFIYVPYTYFIPFYCDIWISKPFRYLTDLLWYWLVPTFVICVNYYIIKSTKTIKSK